MDSASWVDEARKRKKKYYTPMKRFTGELKVSENDADPKIPCRVLFSDISDKSIGLFCTKQLEVGAHITLILEQPKHLFVKAEVVSCHMFSMHTKVISVEHFPYRAALKLVFESPEQAKEFSSYIENISKNFAA